jgi:hypothetical protein
MQPVISSPAAYAALSARYACPFGFAKGAMLAAAYALAASWGVCQAVAVVTRLSDDTGLSNLQEQGHRQTHWMPSAMCRNMQQAAVKLNIHCQPL